MGNRRECVAQSYKYVLNRRMKPPQSPTQAQEYLHDCCTCMPIGATTALRRYYVVKTIVTSLRFATTVLNMLKTFVAFPDRSGLPTIRQDSRRCRRICLHDSLRIHNSWQIVAAFVTVRGQLYQCFLGLLKIDNSRSSIVPWTISLACFG